MTSVQFGVALACAWGAVFATAAIWTLGVAFDRQARRLEADQEAREHIAWIEAVKEEW